MSLDDRSIKALLVEALGASNKAGDAIMEVYRTDLAVESGRTDKSPLTIADRRSTRSSRSFSDRKIARGR